jgi:hypothetical protein
MAYSYPYIGKPPLFLTTTLLIETGIRNIDGLKLLDVSLNNSVNIKRGIPKSSREWSHDPEYFKRKVGLNYCIRLQILPEKSGWVLEPKKARLRVDGKEYIPEKGFIVEMDSRKESHHKYQELPGEKFEIDKLDPTDKVPLFQICFDSDKPSPEKDIELDMSRSLWSENHKTIPIIKFKERIRYF